MGVHARGGWAGLQGLGAAGRTALLALVLAVLAAPAPGAARCLFRSSHALPPSHVTTPPLPASVESTCSIKLNELTPGLESKVAPTDCRLRPDQHCLELGLYDQVSGKPRGVRHAWDGCGAAPRQCTSGLALLRRRMRQCHATPRPIFTLCLHTCLPHWQLSPPAANRIPIAPCLQANSEKQRLEHKQRAARKAAERGDPIRPRWFDWADPAQASFVSRPSGGTLGHSPALAKKGGEELVFKYKGGYWEEREAGHFTGCRDIFGLQVAEGSSSAGGEAA